ncbi:MAG TPA: glycosyltransferase [Solirubrobacteraceae bacterium]|nr:glycosyltransferase [Solirubrobacteraceae bacterium]
MRKILHIITALDVGGAEAMLQKLALGTDRSRFELEVIALTAVGTVGRRIAESGVRVRDMRMSPGRPDARAFARLLRSVHASRPDIVQTWMYHADLLGGLAARAVGDSPVIWGIRGSFDPHKSKRHMIWTARACASLSSWLPREIVSCSTALAQAHVELGYDGRRIRVIPNGFDTATYRPDPSAREVVRAELGVRSQTPLIGHLARWDPQKDHLGFLDAALDVLRRHSGAHVLMCGTGIDENNAALTAALRAGSAGDRVHLLGCRDDVPRVTAALDVLVCSSIYGEGFPNVLGEAMACGVPCVTTDVGDSAMVVGETGRVTPVNDPQALSSAISAMLDLAPQERAALGEAARSRVLERFEIGRVVDRFESLYEEVADGVRHRGLR